MAVMLLIDDEALFERSIRDAAALRETLIPPGREAAFRWLMESYRVTGMHAVIGHLPALETRLAHVLVAGEGLAHLLGA